MDKDLLSSPDLGQTARAAGTTSNVLYFKGNSLWVACSGDSRAVMGQREVRALGTPRNRSQRLTRATTLPIMNAHRDKRSLQSRPDRRLGSRRST